MHYNITINGRVQGVFYRASTQKKAKELGITGGVKNQPDGSVYVEAEGSEDQLNALVEWCKSGPSTAKVDKVAVEKANETKGFDDFEVWR
ncbi:acylphosphatase [Fulvivirga imtechensis AK7]|uniref:acylphosphatase n=2 Tax=Fulvivirga TaxID=396811 RepID=L8JQL8_9BACT|nr:acylphosphatase [Fulvivirga imtechensis AK7]